MCDYDLVKYLLGPSLRGGNVLDPAVQADMVQRRVQGARAGVRFECVPEGVHIAGGNHPRLIRWEDLDQLTIFDEIDAP